MLCFVAETDVTRAMQMNIESFTPEEIVVSAPLGPSANVHNTAFAGAQYVISVLTGWFAGDTTML